MLCICRVSRRASACVSNAKGERKKLSCLVYACPNVCISPCIPPCIPLPPRVYPAVHPSAPTRVSRRASLCPHACIPPCIPLPPRVYVTSVRCSHSDSTLIVCAMCLRAYQSMPASVKRTPSSYPGLIVTSRREQCPCAVFVPE